MNEKIKAIKNYITSKNQTQLKNILVHTSFYRRFVKLFAHIAQALTYMLDKVQ